MFSLILFSKLLEAHPHAHWPPVNHHTPRLVWPTRPVSDESPGVRRKYSVSGFHSCSRSQGSILPRKGKPVAAKPPNPHVYKMISNGQQLHSVPSPEAVAVFCASVFLSIKWAWSYRLAVRLKAKAWENTMSHKVFSERGDPFCRWFLNVDVVRSFPFSDSAQHSVKRIPTLVDI